MKRFFALLLCLAMLLPLVPVSAQATVAEVSAEQKVITVIAGSDFQYSNSDHGIAGGHMESILNAIKADGHTSVDGFLFAGDYSQAFTVDASRTGSAYFKGVVSSHFPDMPEDRKVFIQGNHDPDPLTVDGTLAASGAHDNEDYSVFVMNEKDYMWYSEMDETTVKTTAAQLRSYLNAKRKAGYTKPIFVVTHLQLHYSMRTNIHGDGMYANYLFDVLNEAGANGLNIFFLFGHNHSNGWDDYLGGSAVFLTKGDNILIAQGSQTEFKEETLNFTYLNAGYVGYYTQVNTDAESDLTMTTFQITDEDVTISRYTADGLHDVKAVGVTNAYKGETAYSPDTRTYSSPQTVKLSQQVQPPVVPGVNVEAEGVTDVQGIMGASQVPMGYSAYQSFDISATGYTPGTSATITLPVEAEFDQTRPAVVIDHKRNRVIPVEIVDGCVTFTANHLGLFTVAQASVKGSSATGTVDNYLRFVSGTTELKEEIPYIIVDNLLGTTYQWMLTTQSATYTSTSSGSFQGLLLEELADPNTEYLWYYDNGNLRTANDEYLLITYTGEYNGNATQSLVSVGAYDSANAAQVLLYSRANSTFQIRHPDTANPLYLHRRGGGENNVATTYTQDNASNSLWYFYEVVNSAALTVSPSQTTVSTKGTVFMTPAVTAGSSAVSTYTISWASEDESIATVSADGVVTPKKMGQVYITATLTSVEGSSLSAPATVRILLTVTDTDKFNSYITATTLLGQQLGASNPFDPDNLTPGGPYVIREYYSNWLLTGNQMLTTTEGYNGYSGYEGLEMIDQLPLYGGPAWYLDENGLYLDGSTDQYLVFDGTRVTLGSKSDTNQIMSLLNTAYGASNGWNIYYIGAKTGTAANLNFRGGPPYNVASKTGNSGSYWVLYDLIPERKVSLSVSPISKTLMPNDSNALTASVTVNGVAAEYIIDWTSSDLSVALVDSTGNVTAVNAGNAVITATLRSADGSILDSALSVEIPIQVAAVTDNTTVTMVLDPVLERVTELKSGQAYIISSCLTGNWVMTGNTKPADKDSGYIGLVLEHLSNADDALWYYEEETVDGVTKQYLRNEAGYLLCDNRAVAFGEKSDYAFDMVIADTTYSGSFMIGYSSDTPRYLHQHGGSAYDAAVPTGQWATSQGSRWYFNTLIPERTLSVTMDTAPIQLHPDDTDVIDYEVTVDGVAISDYVLNWKLDGNSVVLDNGEIRALTAGSATVTATLTYVQGHKLDTPIVLEIPVTVEDHSWADATCTTPETCSLCGITRGNPLGHSFEGVVTAPDCTNPGFTTFTCTTCGVSYTDQIVDAQGHAYAPIVTEPTCTTGGYSSYVCSHCGDSYIANEVPALGHSFSEGSCTTCGEKDPDYVALPTLTLNYPTLSFEDEILYNVYYSVKNPENIVEMGLIIFNEKVADGTIADAKQVIPGFVNSGSTYMVQSKGIPAKNLSDTVYFKVYAKLDDGTYVYTDVAGYNAVAYANTVLGKSSSTAKAKALVVAMLNYGAAAQEYFGYKTDALMNAALTAEQQALVSAYSDSMVADVVKADSSKVGSFVMNGGYSNIYPTVSFEGAFSINFYFTPNKTVDDVVTFYYWDAKTYNSVDVLTPENATGVISMAQSGKNWGTAVEGIAAKAIDETVYVAAIYTSNGVEYPTGIVSYSLGNYCKTLAAKGEAFGAATAVYGYYAKAYFA